MPEQNIPEREPISDAFSGLISQFNEHYILSIQPFATTKIVAKGDFVIRYGIAYLGKPAYSIVPDLVVVDYGEMLVGEEAWQFLIEQSNLYPRSDVIGYRNDGTDEMLVVKQLDLAMPIEVLAFAGEADRTPICKLTALIAPENETYPEKMQKYLPRFDTLADWQANNE